LRRRWSRLDANAHSGTYPDPHANSDANANSNSNAHSDPHTNARSNSDSDAHTNAHARWVYKGRAGFAAGCGHKFGSVWRLFY